MTAVALARFIRDAAYQASVELSREKGAFPLFDADKYLAAPSFASRLPSQVKQAIRVHGVRNSHLLAIAPTGTISLAFADNASNGIEPPFSWCYTRKKRMPDDTKKIGKPARRLDQAVGERRFAMVDVGDDGEVADVGNGVGCHGARDSIHALARQPYCAVFTAHLHAKLIPLDAKTRYALGMSTA